ncbi:MFS transporter [Enterococcus alishanensis]|uniref:MFS transporter n=1 Tax=Enterococcus alishanensis TaxID=1303817 RepID=A0ABS6TD28_9ENTE|nr:MFS transporter [Enterococcus alishanensis]MBV7390791.1 MFS transporter [Enterococcus alishanensis]
MRQKNLIFLVLSQVFSVLGTMIVQFTLSLYVLDLTKSALTFSVITALSMIGRLVSLPFCGILADRLPKKRLMILMDSCYLVLTLGLLVVIFYQQSLVLIGGLTVLIGIVSAFETPVVQSTIPLVADEAAIPKVNSVISSVGMLGNLLAPVLAGMIYRFDRVNLIYFLCILLFCLALICEFSLTIPYLKRPMTTSVFKMVKDDSKEVINYLKQYRVIWHICLIAFALNFFLSSFIQVVIPYFSRIHLQISNQEYGIMNGIFALGSLIGTIIFGLLANKINIQFISNFLFQAGILILLLIGPFKFISNPAIAFWTMVILMALMLALVSLISMQMLVYVQTRVRQELLGRMMSLVLIVSTLAMPLGQLLYGWLSQVMAVENMFYIVIIISLLTCLMAFLAGRAFRVKQKVIHVE